MQGLSKTLRRGRSGPAKSQDPSKRCDSPLFDTTRPDNSCRRVPATRTQQNARYVKDKRSAFAWLLVILLGCGPKPGAQQTPVPAVPVKVGKPSRVREAQRVPVSGSVVSPDNPVDVTFLVGGKVIRVGPRAGDEVKLGQILAVIDPVDYALAINSAAAQVANARAALTRTESPVRPELLEQARVQYERAEDEFRRMKMLFDSKSLPPNDFQKSQAAYEVSRQQYEQAKAGGSSEDRAQAKAALDQAAASLGEVEKRLADATLRSPTDGFIASRSIEPGDMASPGKAVFRIVTIDPVEIEVGVPETDIHAVRLGQPARVTIPALPNQSFRGVVRVINVAADSTTRTYMTRIRVPNPQHILRVGMVAEASIEGKGQIDALTLPSQAIVRDPQGAPVVFVYFPDQRRVYSRRVEVGSVRGTQVEIKSGLGENDVVVEAGQDRLRDGVEVELTDNEGTNRK
jgi:multidrug efflux pump subunit AcrA (membrane-fusion protein)